jgi:hypothetical protein
VDKNKQVIELLDDRREGCISAHYMCRDVMCYVVCYVMCYEVHVLPVRLLVVAVAVVAVVMKVPVGVVMRVEGSTMILLKNSICNSNSIPIPHDGKHVTNTRHRGGHKKSTAEQGRVDKQSFTSLNA